MSGGRRDSANSRLDPITFELIYAQLLSAAEEMGGVLKRSSFSPIIWEMNDFSCAIFDHAGDLVAQADYIPAQLGAMSLPVKSTARQWPGALEPGDVFLANHPYMGCMHTPDLNVLMPVFIDARLFGWTGTTAHHIDVGGVNPGTEGADLRQLYAEGLVLPPVHLSRRGIEDEDLISIIKSNVRDPFTTLADLRAQQASCALGARRLEEAVGRYGAQAITAAFAQSLDVVEQATRLALRELPDGDGEAEGYLDDDGAGGAPTRIHALVAKDGDHLTVDLSGSAGQVPGALNVPWASTRASIVFLARAMTDPDMITNDGILRTVDITCPQGSLFLRGWAGYFRYGNSARVLGQVGNYALWRLGLWLSKKGNRRHGWRWGITQVLLSPDHLGLTSLHRIVIQLRPTGTGAERPNAAGEERR